MQLTPFHLAVQVRDIDEARDFYHRRLGLPMGRSADCWIDFDFFGHQLVVHLNPNLGPTGTLPCVHTLVDGHQVPVPHFGLVLPMDQWQILAKRLEDEFDDFIMRPSIRFAGQPGEQATLFIRDPSGNALEFKGFADIDAQMFAVA